MRGSRSRSPGASCRCRADRAGSRSPWRAGSRAGRGARRPAFGPSAGSRATETVMWWRPRRSGGPRSAIDSSCDVSSAVFGLIGVVVGGFLTAMAGYFMDRRKGWTSARAAGLQLTADLEQLIEELKAGGTPQDLGTGVWAAHR